MGETRIGNAFNPDLIQRNFRTALAARNLADETVGIDAGQAHHIAQVADALPERTFGLGHQQIFGCADMGDPCGLFRQAAQAGMPRIDLGQVVDR